MNLDNAIISTISTKIYWTTDDCGNIHLSLRSEGTTSRQYYHLFKTRGFIFSGCVQDVLFHASDKPTSGVVYRVVILPIKNIVGRDRSDRKVIDYGFRRGWQRPHWEVACLIRDRLSSRQIKNMGLSWIVSMHEPINNSCNDPHYLVTSLGADDLLSFLTHRCCPENVFAESGGCVFVIPAKV